MMIFSWFSREMFSQELYQPEVFTEEGQKIKVIGGGLWFKIGEEYRILQFRANVRAEPSINGQIVGVLSLNDKVEIVEYSDVQEVINGTHGFWLKVKFGNIVGYTFSGNIAMRSFITKLAVIEDNDYWFSWETKDRVPVSLHFRRSRFQEDRYFPGYVFDTDNLDNELFFYVNEKRISTSAINIFVCPLDNIEFVGGRTSVLINLFEYSREGTEKFTYRLNNTGVIEFLDDYGDFNGGWEYND
jgi:hypothetical protein